MSNKKRPSERPLPPIQQVRAGLITDPVEIARIEEQFQLQRTQDTEFIVNEVLHEVFDPPYAYRRDLLDVVLGLIEHLTPEQRRSLMQQLQPMPTPAANGPVSEGGTGPT